MTSKFTIEPLGKIIKPIERPEAPIAGQPYRQIGVRLWGEGAYERETIDGAETRYKTLSRVAANDIIVNKIWARNGSVAVVSTNLSGCYASNEFPTFVPIDGRLEPRWFHWYTKTRQFWQQCDEKSRGTSGQNRIRPERFLEILIPQPTLAEQRRIVARIEELSAKIEEARGLRKHAIEEAETVVIAARAKLFEHALQSQTHRLDQAATLERGKFSHRPRNDPRFFGGDHAWIQIGEIESSDKFIRHWNQTLNQEGLAISRKFPRGTVLVSIAATIGAVGILDFDCCVPDSIVALTPKDGTVNEYIYHFLGYVRTHLEDIAPQSAQKNINLKILSALPIPKLGKPDQRRIVAYLDDLQAKADSLKTLQEETAKELNALMPSILSKAFSGEL